MYWTTEWPSYLQNKGNLKEKSSALMQEYFHYALFCCRVSHFSALFNSSWPSATYMRHDFQCLFPQCPRYVALVSMLISLVPHIWGVTNGSVLASPPNSRRSPASLISPAPQRHGPLSLHVLCGKYWMLSPKYCLFFPIVVFHKL